jgi:hypothetical protein
MPVCTKEKVPAQSVRPGASNVLSQEQINRIADGLWFWQQKKESW